MSIHCYFRLATADELDALATDPESIEAFLEVEAPERELHVGQAWHGVHYLLTGCDPLGDGPHGEPPLDFVAVESRGTPIGDIDLGYGPARAFSPSELAAIVRAMESIASDELTRRFERLRREILPPSWGREPQAHELAHIPEALDAARPFLAAGAARDLGLIIFYG
jgi:hypothetical protein